MANAIGAVIIDVKSDISYLVEGMQKAEGVVENATNSMINVVKVLATAYSAVSLKNLIDDTVQSVIEQKAFAEQLSVSVETLSKYEYIASKAHVSTDKLRDAFKDAGTKVTEFQRDGESAKEAFSALGISQDFAKKSMTTTEKSMDVLLQRLAKFPDGMQKATIAQEIFGDEGANVIRVANLGADAIKKYTEEAIKGNIATSEAFAQKSAAYADAQNRLGALQKGWASAVIEESHFLEMGTSMYEQLGDSVMDWTQDVQNGNSEFINSLNVINNGVNAVFPAVIEISGTLGHSFLELGKSVVALSGIVVDLVSVLVGFDDQATASNSSLGNFMGGMKGASMLIENFSNLARTSSIGLKMFSEFISMYAISSLNSLQAKFYNTLSTMSDLLSFLDDDFESDAIKYKNKASELEKASIQAMMGGTDEIRRLTAERNEIYKNIYSIDMIKAEMEKTATAVTLRQKQGIALAKINKKTDDYNKLGKDSIKILEDSMKALDKAKNKKESLSKATSEHEKALKSEATAYSKLKKELESFEDTYKQSTMSDFDYKLELLNKEKNRYIEIGAERLKIDKWYSVEFKKLENAKNEKLQKTLAEAKKQLESFEDTYKQSTMSDFDYKLELLNKEKNKYIEIGAERFKIDKWYSVEFEKLEDAKNEKLQKALDEERKQQELAYDYRKKTLEYQNIEFQINNGYEDRLTFLSRQLDLLISQNDIERNTSEELDFVILKEQKKLEIIKEIETKNKNILDFNRELRDSMGTYVGYDAQISEQTQNKIDELNKRAKELHQPLLTDEEIKKINQKIKSDIAPTFSESIAKAFNINTNKSLKDNLQDLKGILAGVGANAFQSISADYAQTGDITQAINNYTDSNALRDGLKNSGNPYAMAVGYGSELISGALSEPMDEFQKMASNIDGSNRAVQESISLTNTVLNTDTEISKQMRDYLRDIRNGMGGLAKNIYQKNDFATGQDFSSSHSFNGNQGAIEFGNLFGNVLGEDNAIGQLHTSSSNALFGDVATSLKEAGISLGEQTVEAFLQGVDAQQYQIVEQTKKYLFGLIKSSTYETNFREISDATERMLQGAVGSGIDVIQQAGESLGFDASALQEAIQQHVIDPKKWDFRDMDEAQINAEITGWIGSELESITSESLPALEAFRDANESAFENLVQVTTQYSDAKEALANIGVEAVKLLDISNKNGSVDTETIRDSIIKFDNSHNLQNLTGLIQDFEGSATGLIDFYETIETLNTRIQIATNSTRELSEEMLRYYSDPKEFMGAYDAYLADFYTDAERSDIKMRELNREFASMNIELPKTTESYREWLESLNDDELYGWGVKYADDFYQVTKAIENANKQLFDSIADAWTGRLSYLNSFQKTDFLQGYYALSKKSAGAIDQVEASKMLAEAAKETTKSQAEYIPLFNNYIKELRNQKKDATNKDLLDELKNLIQEVLELKEATYETARVS